MSLRLPYLVSLLGHLVVFSAFVALSTFVVHSNWDDLVPIMIMPPPLGSGAKAAAQTDQEDPAASSSLQTAEDPPPEEITPAVEPDLKPPKPVRTSQEVPSPEGTLEKADEIPSIDGDEEQRPDTVNPQPISDPAPTPEDPLKDADEDNIGTGGESAEGGEDIGIEGGALGAHAHRYLGQLRRMIGEKWRPPPAIRGRHGVVTARVKFEILSNGDVGSWDLVESSGNSLFDRAAVRAVLDAQPFPNIPADLGTDPIPILLNLKQTY